MKIWSHPSAQQKTAVFTVLGWEEFSRTILLMSWLIWLEMEIFACVSATWMICANLFTTTRCFVLQFGLDFILRVCKFYGNWVVIPK